MYIKYKGFRMPARSKEQTGVLQLKVVLEGEMLKRFLEVKKEAGLENNSEIVRMLITEAYNKFKLPGR
jgi:hypothetical protein